MRGLDLYNTLDQGGRLLEPGSAMRVILPRKEDALLLCQIQVRDQLVDGMQRRFALIQDPRVPVQADEVILMEGQSNRVLAMADSRSTRFGDTTSLGRVPKIEEGSGVTFTRRQEVILPGDPAVSRQHLRFEAHRLNDEGLKVRSVGANDTVCAVKGSEGIFWNTAEVNGNILPIVRPTQVDFSSSLPSWAEQLEKEEAAIHALAMPAHSDSTRGLVGRILASLLPRGLLK